MEVGTGQEDKALCHQGIHHNYHNSHHISALALEQGVHNLAGCLQRRVVEVAGMLLEVLVLAALEGILQEEEEQHSLRQSPVLELDTGH